MNIESLIGRKTLALGPVGAAQHVTIRELSWPDALELFNRISKRVADLGVVTAVSPMEAAATALSSSKPDIEFLLTKSTDLSPTQIEAAPASLIATLVNESLAMTISDELLTAGKGVAQRLRMALGANTPPSSSSSSASATPAPGATR